MGESNFRQVSQNILKVLEDPGTNNELNFGRAGGGTVESSRRKNNRDDSGTNEQGDAGCLGQGTCTLGTNGISFKRRPLKSARNISTPKFDLFHVSGGFRLGHRQYSSTQPVSQRNFHCHARIFAEHQDAIVREGKEDMHSGTC